MVLEVGGIALLKLAVGAASVAYSVYNQALNQQATLIQREVLFLTNLLIRFSENLLAG